jgi:hypothetical protein
MSNSPHCIYVISNKFQRSFGPTKIGRSTNVEARLKSLQTANPAKLMIVSVFTMPTYELAQHVETGIHGLLASRNLQGEWFDVCPIKATSAICCVTSAIIHLSCGLSPEQIEFVEDFIGIPQTQKALGEYITPDLLMEGGEANATHPHH